MSAGGFVTVDREHAECEDCDRAAERAADHATVTGSIGGTWIDDGRALTTPHYHAATVRRVLSCGCYADLPMGHTCASGGE